MEADLILLVLFLPGVLLGGSAISLYLIHRRQRRRQKEQEVQRTTRQRLRQISQGQ